MYSRNGDGASIAHPIPRRIVLMSPAGLSLGRLLSSRASLRFTRQPSRYTARDSRFNCLLCRRIWRATSSLWSRVACISAWRPSSMSKGVT